MRRKRKKEMQFFLGCILIFANIFVGAKHFGSKSLILTNKLSAEMLRPCKIEMYPLPSCSSRLRGSFK